MESISAYIISVIAVCLCSAILRKVVGEKGTNAAVMNALCGVVLAITVIAPVIRVDISDIGDFIEGIQADSSSYVQYGTDLSEQELRSVITEQAQAYIFQEAATYNCNITDVEISLSEDKVPTPDSVKITGAYSPQIKNQLSGMIASKLGISKENQEWIYRN